MVADPVLILTDAPDPVALSVIGDGLNAYNDLVTGYADRQPLAVLITDPATGAVVGGLSGRTSLGMLFIELVCLPESLRGQDIGTRIVGMAEAEAVRRGCRTGVLYTMTIQAPGFYQRLGWRVFGEIACDPPGNHRVFLTKTLGS
jgi:GNAT superfamily N-acetyltransferase